MEIIAALPLREKLPSADGDEVSVDFNDPLLCPEQCYSTSMARYLIRSRRTVW